MKTCKINCGLRPSTLILMTYYTSTCVYVNMDLVVGTYDEVILGFRVVQIGTVSFLL